MAEFYFWSMLAVLLTHELDAIRRHEWRIMPLINLLSDKAGEQTFIWSHVPLLFLIFWFSRDGAASGFAQFLSGFSIVHIGLHWMFRNHPANEFNNSGSWGLILLAGALGALHLAA